MLRFAISPIGDFNINSLRIAILNYIIAKQRNEQFLVRIDDIEQLKNIEGKDTEIMMILEKFAIKHDTVYHQSEHLNIYQNLAIRLLKEKKAFICKCTNEVDSCSKNCENLNSEDYKKLQQNREPFVIRLKEAKNDFVIIRTDNKPTHNFATACDDMLNGITLVITEEKYKSDITKQIHIKSSLKYNEPTKYIYLSNILNSNNISIKWLFEEGFIPDAILNYLILLDNPKAKKEIFTLPEAIEWFDLDNIPKNNIEFDIEKLKYINKEHLKRIDNKKLSTLFGFADADIGKLAKIYLTELNTINELKTEISSIFNPKNFDNIWQKEMRIIENIIYNSPTFETLDKLKEHIRKESGLDNEKLSKPLTLLLTNKENEPKLNEIYPLIKSYILEVAS